jgi:hypothetical protein
LTTVRRVITAETESGKSFFKHVEEVEGIESHIRHHAIWGWDQEMSLPPPEGSQFAPKDAFPPLDARHGVRISMAEFRPDSDPRNVRNPHDEMGKRLIGGRMRERDLVTGMHRTDTIDVVFVIEGEITLEQDDGEEVTLRKGDVLVQNGARHNWSNRTDKPALLGFVLIAADRVDRDAVGF